MGQDDTKHNLLFISKYPEIIHEFTDAMKDRDIEIETAINGIEAAAKIKKKNYDIVITGLSLEGYNGEQIITYLNKTAPSTVCIIYTTTISSAQLHFFINERNVFRVFLRPVDFRGAFWEALEEAYEYHAEQVKNEEDTGARRQEQEKQEREIEIMDQRMRSQRQAISNRAQNAVPSLICIPPGWGLAILVVGGCLTEGFSKTLVFVVKISPPDQLLICTAT